MQPDNVWEGSETCLGEVRSANKEADDQATEKTDVKSADNYRQGTAVHQ